MKKFRDNLGNIIISLVLVFVLVFATFAGIAEAKNQDDGTDIEEIDNKATEANTSIGNRNSNLGSNNFTLGATNGLWTSSMLANTETSSSDEELAQIKKALSDAKAANEQLSAELDASQVKQVVEKAEKERLEKLANDLQEQLNAVHPIREKNGKIWVHVDDFLNYPDGVGAIVHSRDGYAMRSAFGEHIKVYDDMSGDEHLNEMFDLPMIQAYEIALTADEGKTAFVANFGCYNYANGGLFTKFESVRFPQSLTSKTKNGGLGYNYYELIKSCAVVTTADDGSYRFALYAGDFEANPEIKKPEPEKVIERVETKVEVEKIVYRDREVTKVIEICGRCKKLYSECTCPDVEVVVVEKKYCGRCGELYEECTCKEPEPVIIKELVPVYIYVNNDDPNNPNYPNNNPSDPNEGEPAKGNKPENSQERLDQGAISDTSGTDTDITGDVKDDIKYDGNENDGEEDIKYDGNENDGEEDIKYDISKDGSTPDSSDDIKYDSNGTDSKEDVKDDTNKDGTTKEDSTTPDSSDDIKYDGNGTDSKEDVKDDTNKDGTTKEDSTTPDNSEDIKYDGNENDGEADNGGNVLNDGNQGVNEISDTTAGVYNDISGNTYNDSTGGTFSDTTGDPENSRCPDEGSYS